MDSVKNWFLENWSTVIVAVVCLLSTVFGGKINLKGVLKKMAQKESANALHYKTNAYGVEAKAQNFSQYVPIFRLNKAKNIVESTGEVIDLKELINSALPSCLTEILNRFTAEDLQTAKYSEISDYSDEMRDRLDVAKAQAEYVENLRKKYNLPFEKYETAESVFTAVKSMYDVRKKEFTEKQEAYIKSIQDLENEKQKIAQAEKEGEKNA